MLISKAYAADDAGINAPVTTTMADGSPVPAAAQQPSAVEAFIWNMGLILVLVVLFYILLIMPQQRRFKEHSTMLAGLKKGDKVITGGGFVGVIDKVVDDQQVLVDLGNGVKVTALRSSLQGKNENILKKPANDQKS